ncbi:hypothetical protein ILUMI_16224, partial [Ignelater luminosus]
MVFCKNKKEESVEGMEESLNRCAKYFQEVYGSREKGTGDIESKRERSTGNFRAKILRRLCRGKEEGGVWKRRTNKEVMELYEELSITNIARVQRIRWLGHVGRMEIERPTKQALLREISERRKREKRRKTWLQAVKKNIEKMG